MVVENIESFHFISIPDSRLISNEKRNLLPNGSYLTENVHFFSLANLPNEFYPSIYKAEKFYELENVLLELLFQKLNLMHQSEWTKKDYEILVSHWLQGFLTILEKKLTCMSKILNHREISSSTFFAPDLGIIAPKDFSDFVDKTFDPIWNNMLDGEIWEYLTQNEFQNLIPNYIRYMGSSNLSKYLNERRSLKVFF